MKAFHSGISKLLIGCCMMNLTVTAKMVSSTSDDFLEDGDSDSPVAENVNDHVVGNYATGPAFKNWQEACP